mgnify:CR=1 FL=1
MDSSDIASAYEVLAQEVRDRNVQEAARIGNAQRSLGTLAARVASPTGQTSGLANYTYNRTLRPAVETAATSLITQGKASSLENYLNEQLRAAKNAYEDAKNRYTVASTTPKTTNYGTDKLPIDTNTGDGEGKADIFDPRAGQIIPNTEYSSDYQDPTDGQWYILTSPTSIDASALAPLTSQRMPQDGEVLNVNGKSFRYVGSTNSWYQQTKSAGPGNYTARTR